MIHIYCGDGKGKTTAAFGLALRASAGGYRVVIIQFLKGRSSCEQTAISAVAGVTLLTADLPDAFSWQMTDRQRQQVLEAHNGLFARGVACCEEGKTLLVLDELLDAFSEKLIDSEAVMSFLRKQGEQEGVETVITGRNPSAELVELAHYVTEMKKIKHPFDKGAQMRKGIEY